MMRKLIIGDIHGCFDELEELLARVGPGPDDTIIALGDLVDRGPDTPKVLTFFETHENARTIMGNHERKHVRAYLGEVRPSISQQISRVQIGEDAYPDIVREMRALPSHIELDEAICLHGFFQPGLPLEAQREIVLVGTLTAERHLGMAYDRPWFELYDGTKPIIAGHHHYLGNGAPLVVNDKVFCIDTGCCYGFALTGLVLPDFRLVSVPARRNHWRETRARFAHLFALDESAKNETLTWKKIDEILTASEAQAPLGAAVSQRVEKLRQMVARADALIEAIFDEASSACAQILDALRRDHAFDNLDAKEQGRLFAVRIAGHPLRDLLHAARKGRLSVENLHHRLNRPKKVFDLARKVGLDVDVECV
jgi:serine/threonine protein phosphatase 1